METNAFKEQIEYGEQLFQNGQLAEALEAFESVLEKDPDNTEALNDRGVVLNSLGKYGEAIQSFSHILSMDRTNANAVFNLISNLLSAGNWKAAEETLNRYGRYLSPQDFALIKNDLEKINRHIHSMNKTSCSSRIECFDYKGYQERINKVFEKTLFFIVGCPKSGTTWLQNILNGHPNIFCPGESAVNMLHDGLRDLADRYNREIVDMNERYIGHNSGYYLITDRNLEYLFGTLIAMLLTNLDDAWQVDCIGTKNPDHMKCMETSLRMLPKAKYVHIIRDGRDVTVSGMFHNLRVNPEGFRNLFPQMENYVDTIARAWAADIRKARVFGRSFPEHYLELRYEDLQNNPDSIILRMLEFLGVDASEEMIDLCRENGSFKKLSKGRQRGQENRDSFFRKGIVGDWKNHFSKDSYEIFQRHAGNLLRELNYE